IEFIDHIVVETFTELHFDAIVAQNMLDDAGVTVCGDSLITAGVIRIIVAEADWKPVEHGGWKLPWFATPLLLGITVKERLVQLASNHLEGAFLEILRFDIGSPA